MIYSSTTKPVSSLLEDSNFFHHKDALWPVELSSWPLTATTPVYTKLHTGLTAEIHIQTGLTGSQHNRTAILELRGAFVEANVHPFF